MTFAAKHRGPCAGGCEGIEPGDEVEFVDDALMHVDCEDAEGVRPEPKQAETCPTCWLERPCGCDD